MRQIFERELDKIIRKKEFLFDFQVEKDEIYGIEITASAKSWWQNLVRLRSFFKDDDLTLKIDEIEFPKRGLKQKRLFDGEVAWNGNNLQGKKKTDLFLIKLNKGNHALTFLTDQKPKIHSVRIYQIKENEEELFSHSAECENINYFPKDNYPIEDGNRRQWLAIILVNLALKFLKITASAKEGRSFLFFKKDDSDLKLIINNQIQKNREPKSHKNWYWCGRTLKGKEKTFEKELNLHPNIHYLELWADRSPEVKEIKIGIEKRETYPFFTLDDVKQYDYKGVKGDENYNRFDREILEAVNFWNKFFFSQKYPPEEPLNPNLVKAMVYVESRMGYEKGGFPDVMQVWDEANNTPQTIRGEKGYPANEYISDTQIGHMKYSYPKEWLPPKAKTTKESIFWGVRWLYHKAQYLKTKDNKLIYPYVRIWRNWEEALPRYNPKPWYKNRVLKIYKAGIDQNGNILWEREEKEKGRISLKILLTGLVFIFSLFGIFLLRNSIIESKKLPENFQLLQKIQIDKSQYLAVFQEISSAQVGFALLDRKLHFKKWLPHAGISLSSQFPKDTLMGDHFNWLKRGDFNKDGIEEIAIQTQYAGPARIHLFYLYQLKEENPKLLLYLEDSASENKFKDFNRDGIFEVLHIFSLDGTGLAGRTLTKWKEVWTWDGEKYRKASNLYPEIYSALIEEYEQDLKNPPDEESMIHYRPVIKCLLEKAKQNQKGVFADGRDCLKFE